MNKKLMFQQAQLQFDLYFMQHRGSWAIYTAE
jgi:hypothetical protein